MSLKMMIRETLTKTVRSLLRKQKQHRDLQRRGVREEPPGGARCSGLRRRRGLQGFWQRGSPGSEHGCGRRRRRRHHRHRQTARRRTPGHQGAHAAASCQGSGKGHTPRCAGHGHHKRARVSYPPIMAWATATELTPDCRDGPDIAADGQKRHDDQQLRRRRQQQHRYGLFNRQTRSGWCTVAPSDTTASP